VVSRRGEFPKKVAFQTLDVARAGSTDEPFAPLVTLHILGNPQKWRSPTEEATVAAASERRIV